MSTLTQGFRALRVRNYRLFWIGQLISLVGSWMQTTAQGWLALKLTDDPFAVGLVTTCQFLPMMAFSLFGGAIADRFPKRTLLLIAQIAALIHASLFGFLVAFNLLQLWHLYLLAGSLGLINSIEQPTRQSFVAELVTKEDLVNAVGLNSVLFNSARIIGPALAGMLIAQFGSAPVLFANAVSFIAVIIGLKLMNPAEFLAVSRQPQGSITQNVREGLGYAWRNATILQILVVVAVIGTFGFNFTVILPLIAGFVLNANAAEFGGLASFVGFGALGAALTTAFSKQVSLRRLLAASLAFGILLTGLAFARNYAVVALVLVVLGYAGIIFGTSANTLIQLNTPDTLRGRVIGIYMLLFVGSTPIGALLIGAISRTFSVPTALMICGILCILGVLGALTMKHD